jgi:hypothetical protein
MTELKTKTKKEKRKKKKVTRGIQFGNMRMLTLFEILCTPCTHNPILKKVQNTEILLKEHSS